LADPDLRDTLLIALARWVLSRNPEPRIEEEVETALKALLREQAYPEASR